jgi:predicted dehydrogenase
MNTETGLRFGIVGCGRMGRLHTERLHADGRGDVVAVCDAPEQLPAARSLRDQLAPAAQVYADFEELLQKADLDAAVICTPTTLHLPQVLACRSRDWHVLCEKPLAATREEILRLIDEARASRPLLSVAYQRRYWTAYRTLRREVLSGRWGEVRAVTSINAERWQQTIIGTWRDDPAVNWGGFIGDAGSHKIDAVFYVTGLVPVEVFATADLCGSRVEVVANVSARLERGVPLSMSFVGNSEAFNEDLHIHCAEADLKLRDCVLTVYRNGRPEPIGAPEPHSDPDAAFLDLIGGASARNVAPPECALPVFDFTAAILESSRTGRPVRIGEAGVKDSGRKRSVGKNRN